MTSRRLLQLAASSLLFMATSASADRPAMVPDPVAAPTPAPAPSAPAPSAPVQGPASAPPTKSACVAAAAEGQKLRRAGNLLTSRSQFAICASDACPDVVRTDCVNWQAEVFAGIPSIVIRIRRAGGGDVAGARLKLDGVERATTDHEGKPLEVDPGAHEISVETPQGNARQSLVVVTGEKNRVVTIEVGTPPPAVGEAAPHRPVTTERPVPVLTYILGGVAVVGGASFTLFGLQGQSKFDDLERECGSRCDPSRVSPVKTDMAIADISLAVGVVALVGAAVVYLTRPTVEVPSHSARLGARR